MQNGSIGTSPRWPAGNCILSWMSRRPSTGDVRGHGERRRSMQAVPRATKRATASFFPQKKHTPGKNIKTTPHREKYTRPAMSSLTSCVTVPCVHMQLLHRKPCPAVADRLIRDMGGKLNELDRCPQTLQVGFGSTSPTVQWCAAAHRYGSVWCGPQRSGPCDV
jgi:hypothetical protein